MSVMPGATFERSGVLQEATLLKQDTTPYLAIFQSARLIGKRKI